MVSRTAVRQDGGPPAKRRKVEKAGLQTFQSTAEILQSIRDSDEAGLTRVLTAIRNQLTVKHYESAAGPQDERILLAKAWMESSPGAQNLFDLWSTVNQRQMSLCALIVSVLTCLVNLLTTHYTFHSLGLAIVKLLLSSHWSQRLNSYINGSNSELILVSLKLYNAMSNFASGRERKAVLEAFPWENKASKLLKMRRRTKNEDTSDTLLRPDIRTLYILFILSFLDPLTSGPVKSTFLEQHREVVSSIFKGFDQDSYSVVRKVLETFWTGLLSDGKIKRTLKITLFNEEAISHILKLYERTSPEGDPEHIPANLAHHFLLAICTHPGSGVCFKDRGWYPRDAEGDADLEEKKSGKIYNKILANLLKVLKVNDDLRQQELALKIMAVCPELVAGCWSATGLTLEPRLSSKWLANISFLGSVVSLPVPTRCFLLPDSDLCQPTPPPTSIILENVFPSVNLKNHLSKGLQSPSPLVQHCTALALAKCLRKYGEILRAFEEIAKSLEEDDEGQWKRRIQDIEKEVRRRVPDFQVVVAFAQQKLSDISAPQSETTLSGDLAFNPQRLALLSECALRLLWLYHGCLPLLVGEARFDVGKLLSNFLGTPKGTTVENEEGQNTGGLHILRQLHVLRLLKESDQFIWSGRIGSSTNSNFHILLKAYISSEVQAIRAAIASLLQHSLSENILFQHDTDEVHSWLESLSIVQRSESAEAPDGAPLGDEGIAIVKFLDDCALRCAKTPYKYLEELCSAAQAIDDVTNVQSNLVAERPEAYPSPLLMTVVEQLSAKVTGKLLSASDTLAVVSYIRKLVFKFAGKVQDLQFLEKIVERVDTVLKDDLFLPEYPSMSKGIRREVSILRTGVQNVQNPEFSEHCEPSVEMKGFLDQLDSISVDSASSSSQGSAFELVDWLRLVDHPLHPSEACRFVSTVGRFHKPALRVLFEYFHPGRGLIWDGALVSSNFDEIRSTLDFNWLFVQTSNSALRDRRCRECLVLAVFTNRPNLLEVKKALCLIGHRIRACPEEQLFLNDLLQLSNVVVENAKTLFTFDDFKLVKRYIFWQLDAFQTLFRSPLADFLRKATKEFLHKFLDSGDAEDKALVAELVIHWCSYFKTNTTNSDYADTMALWIPFMERKDVFSVLDALLGQDGEKVNPLFLRLLESVLVSLHLSRDEPGVIRGLQARLCRLLPLSTSSNLAQSTVADIIAFSLPLFHDGILLTRRVLQLQPVIKEAGIHWGHRLDKLSDRLDIDAYLSQSPWSDVTVKITTILLYRSHSARAKFFAWIRTSEAAQQSIQRLVFAIHAFLDSYSIESSQPLTVDAAWISLFDRLVGFFFDDSSDRESRSVCGSCISLLLRLSSERPKLLKTLEAKLGSLTVGNISVDLLLLGRKVCVDAETDSRKVAVAIVELGLQWAVHCLSLDMLDKTETHLMLKYLSILISNVGSAKAHLVEPVLAPGIKNHLHDDKVVDFCGVLCKYAKLKPVIVNRNIQSIVQHIRFFTICAVVHTSSASKTAVIRLLHTLFHLNPASTCQQSHIEPLRQVYGGTLSVSDREIFSIFQLFEIQRKMSCASIICRWSSSGEFVSKDSLAALQSLDSSQVFSTCLQFPKWRRCNETSVDKGNGGSSAKLYDPIFIMLLFAHMTVENPPTSPLIWVELFRTNVACVIIRALSSKDDHTRGLALSQLMGLWKRLETADMQEKPHVVHILNLLKDTISPAPKDNPPSRIPAYVTLVLSHALRGVFYPSNFIYPLTARFLLQRPELDIHDVPMLFGMLYSNSDTDWKKERTWIIRFLSDGMINTDDWKVLKRRHTWDLLASMFQSFDKDRGLRSGILEVLANITCNRYATTSLLLKSGLLSWIEMQLQTTVKNGEGIAWVRILENILTVVDPVKIGAATKGEWRKTLARCLMYLLNSSAASSIFADSVSVILRLGVMASEDDGTSLLVDTALMELKKLETTIVVLGNMNDDGNLEPQPFHYAQGLYEIPEREPVQVWGRAVETLWRVAMSCEKKNPSWDELTYRLLVWRSIAGEESADVVCEWTRREAVVMMMMMNEPEVTGSTENAV